MIGLVWNGVCGGNAPMRGHNQKRITLVKGLQGWCVVGGVVLCTGYSGGGELG